VETIHSDWNTAMNDNYAHNSMVVATKRPGLRYVVGPDLDVDLCKSLVPGDHVLLEVNGGRYYTEQKNPLVAEEPWIILENDWFDEQSVADGPTARTKPRGQLVLKHGRVAHPVILDYDQLLNLPKGQPAVFKTTKGKNEHLPDGPLYVILQLIAFKLTEDRVDEAFPMMTQAMHDEFLEILEDDRLKVGLLEDWSGQLARGVKENGWKYNSVKRIGLRAAVPFAAVKAFVTRDYKAMLALSDDELIRLRRECHWLKMLLKQAGYIQHDPTREFIKPDATA
jgi:hypothetical protein